MLGIEHLCPLCRHRIKVFTGLLACRLKQLGRYPAVLLVLVLALLGEEEVGVFQMCVILHVV